jgi:hypothetical protein
VMFMEGGEGLEKEKEIGGRKELLIKSGLS